MGNPIVVEDWLCMFGLLNIIGLFACVVCFIQLAHVGEDFDDWDYPAIYQSRYHQLTVSYEIIWALALGFIKSSIVGFYIRVFFSVSWTNRIVAYCVIALIWSWVAMCILSAFLICVPFRTMWDPATGGYCDNLEAVYLAGAAIDLATDIMVFVMPLRPIWRLKTSRSKRIALFGIFGLGLATMALAILRVDTFIYGFGPTSFKDRAASPIIYSFVEPCIGIVVSCAPLLQPLYRNTWFGRVLAGTARRVLSYGSTATGIRSSRRTNARTTAPVASPVAITLADADLERSIVETTANAARKPSDLSTITITREFMVHEA